MIVFLERRLSLGEDQSQDDHSDQVSGDDDVIKETEFGHAVERVNNGVGLFARYGNLQFIEVAI